MWMNDLWLMVVAVTAITVGMWGIVAITKLIVSYFQGRKADHAALTTSELSGVIGRAVEEAVKPLEEKIDRLERQQRLLAESRPRELERRPD